MAYTVTDLLADIRREAMLPSSTAAGTADDDILASAQYEIETRLTPLILSVREEYLLVQKYITTVANQSQYRFPRRCIAGRLRDVCLKLADGSLKQLQRIELEQARRIYSLNTGTGEPEAFAVRGEYLILYPTPTSASYRIRLEVPVRPARMSTSQNYAEYDYGSVSISSTACGFTMDGATGLFPSGSAVDFVRGDNGFTPWAVDVQLLSVTPDGAGGYTTSTLLTSLPDEPLSFFPTSGVAGVLDTAKIYTANITNDIPLPVELHGVLVQYVAARIKRQLGDLEQASYYEGIAKRMETDALRTLTPRIEGPPRKMMGGVLWKQRGPWFTGVR